MLGYFKTPDVVGLYNGALPLANLVSMPLGSTGFIYLPIISQLYSQNLMQEIKTTYQVLTKWVFAISFPIFLLLFLFPEVILSFCFGAQYVKAALALRILAAGLMFHTFLGANGMTLLVMGKSKPLMWASLLAASINIILNIILIPQWGIVGAATASLISFFVYGIFRSISLYQLSGIHPFTKSYLKPIIASGTIISIIYILTRNLLTVTYWMLPLLVILFLGLYALSLLLTRSFDAEDGEFLLAIEKRTGINASCAKKILRRFL